ncbi:aminoglycoside phosphotransferase family protein [Rugosimonospora africana]|uniref:Streptomycin 6-kinase n=1 Tax=Rugosimonospora africana TaxID=556532 RepID=A0A8J3R0D2_9ACTN|nr:aminoglycoside phosphotransferase family protein [Rugosimonospora africana]GIH20670.1 hypothetical protein Raf01_88420 [Rugosimonospora africana]
MNQRPIEVPTWVRQKATHLGARGEQWLAGLADLVAALERDWSIAVEQPLTGGSASYVARVRAAGGGHAVVKVALPGEDVASQVRTIEDAAGRGYVGIIAYDLDRGAMLLESLGPSMAQLGLAPERAIVLLCETLREAWRMPRPAVATELRVNETVGPPNKARALGEMVAQLWEPLGRPCSERVVTEALRCAERRSAAHDPHRCVVVHGDPHPGNALRVVGPRPGAGSGFVFVDPDGFLAEPAYDLGVVLRDWGPQLLAAPSASVLARRYCRLLADETGVDEDSIWEWGFLERVSTGLYATDFGAHDLGRRFLETAELLV